MMKYHKLGLYAKMNPNKIGRDILYTLGAFLVFTGVSYSIHITLGRKLGPAEYGIFGIIISLITVIELFFFKGMRDTVTKYTSEFPQKARTIKHKSLRIQLVFALFLSGIYFLLSRHLAELLRDETLFPFTMGLSPDIQRGKDALSPLVKLKWINENIFLVSNLEALIIDIPGYRDYGLLGQNFLNNFHIEIDNQNGILLLKKR